MTSYGFILTVLGLTALAGMFCFNDRFRQELGRTAFKWRWLILIPGGLYAFFSLFLGFATTNALLPGAIGVT
ncbi:hypothetical protein ABTH30_24235, partial [Acinetobacter baumannii]